MKDMEQKAEDKKGDYDLIKLESLTLETKADIPLEATLTTQFLYLKSL